MAGMQRETIDKSKIEGKKIVWIMGRLILELMIDIICTCYNLPLLHFHLYIYSFAGGPGSGRGTQCEKLVLKHKFKHLSSGDLLRHEVMSGSQRGGNLYKLMSTGEPVPNGIVNDLIAEAMVKFADGNDVCSRYRYTYIVN